MSASPEPVSQRLAFAKFEPNNILPPHLTSPPVSPSALSLEKNSVQALIVHPQEHRNQDDVQHLKDINIPKSGAEGMLFLAEKGPLKQPSVRGRSEMAICPPREQQPRMGSSRLPGAKGPDFTLSVQKTTHTVIGNFCGQVNSKRKHLAQQSPTQIVVSQQKWPFPSTGAEKNPSIRVPAKGPVVMKSASQVSVPNPSEKSSNKWSATQKNPSVRSPAKGPIPDTPQLRISKRRPVKRSKSSFPEPQNSHPLETFSSVESSLKGNGQGYHRPLIGEVPIPSNKNPSVRYPAKGPVQEITFGNLPTSVQIASATQNELPVSTQKNVSPSKVFGEVKNTSNKNPSVRYPAKGPIKDI